MPAFYFEQDKQAEKLFFDHFAGQRQYLVFKEKSYERIMGFFENFIKPKKGEKIADLGCGGGAFIGRFQNLSLNVVGLDISFKNVASVKATFPASKIIAGDIMKTPFDDNSFDILFYGAVLHHFPNLIQALKEGYRILKRGGRLFAFDPNYRNPAMWFYRFPNSPFYSKAGLTDNERLLKKKELLTVLQESGFKRIQVEGISGIPFSYIKGHAARQLLFFYNLWEEILGRTVLAKVFGSFLLSWGTK